MLPHSALVMSVPAGVLPAGTERLIPAGLGAFRAGSGRQGRPGHPGVAALVPPSASPLRASHVLAAYATPGHSPAVLPRQARRDPST